MEGAGLIDFWTKQWSADPSYCLKKNDQLLMNNNKIAARKEDKKRLTLKCLIFSSSIYNPLIEFQLLTRVIIL